MLVRCPHRGQTLPSGVPGRVRDLKVEDVMTPGLVALIGQGG
jgi:hypothetical protein